MDFKPLEMIPFHSWKSNPKSNVHISMRLIITSSTIDKLTLWLSVLENNVTKLYSITVHCKPNMFIECHQSSDKLRENHNQRCSCCFKIVT